MLSQDYGAEAFPIMQRTRTPMALNGGAHARELRSSAGHRSQSPYGGTLPSPERKLTWADMEQQQKEQYMKQLKRQGLEMSERKRQLRSFLDDQVRCKSQKKLFESKVS